MEENHPTLEQAKLAQIEALNISYAEFFVFDVELDGHRYQADIKSYSEMLAAAAQPSLPDDFYWLDSENYRVPFDSQKLQQLVSMVFAKRLELFKDLQDKKQGVRDATEINQLFLYKP
jgi:hypothetical protein